MNRKDMEIKSFPALGMKVVNEAQGVVEHIITVFGVYDQGGDISHPGSFSKTLVERGNKVRVVDAHNYDSVMRAIGKPLEIREIRREDLPAEVLQQYPEATGGVWARTQFLMDTPEGKGAFIRIKEEAIGEWSYGYDALDVDYGKMTVDSKEVTVRNLRSIRMYEYSPVLWGLNPATATLSAKDVKPAPEVTENTIRIRVRDPGDFQEDSFRTINISEDQGIQAVVGRLEGETSMTVQAYVFAKDKWTVAKAQAWVQEHEKMEEKEAIDGETVDSVEADEEPKAGRVLARRNEARIVGALRTLIEVLEDAGISVPGQEEKPEKEDEDDKEKNATVFPVNINTPPISTELLAALEADQRMVRVAGVAAALVAMLEEDQQIMGANAPARAASSKGWAMRCSARANAPARAAEEKEQNDTQAGPDEQTPPTSREGDETLLKQIELEVAFLNLMEVECGEYQGHLG